jgi:hypothetical protein
VNYDITPRKYLFSERILGKAIKELKLPRDEIVIMTKADLSFFFFMYLYRFSIDRFIIRSPVHLKRNLDLTTNPNNTGMLIKKV